ncbi:response regulator [Paenibacillaceae bacterium]|nr:response regulator [Paenibacillaceae bacterium]
MLTMILADDDYMVRDTLRAVIPWEEYGISVIAEAEHGRKALDLCLELSPDILFTDIKMPFMDGLEVAMHLKDTGSHTKIIIISGIQDFNYAKTALDVNAEGYILKPIQIADIREVIAKVVNQIDMERNMSRKIETLKQQLHENASLLREKFIRNVLLGVLSGKSEIEDKLAYFQIAIKPDEGVVASVLQLDDYASQVKYKKEADKQLTSFAIQNVIGEIIRNYEAGIVYSVHDNEFAIIFNEKSQQYDKYIEISEEVVNALHKYLKISASMGLGNRVDGLDRAYVSYQNAHLALQHRFYMGPRSIIRIEDIADVWGNQRQSTGIEYHSLLEAEQQLIGFIMLGDLQGGLDLLDSLFQSFIHADVETIRGFCIELISGTYRKCFVMGEQLETIVPNRNQLLASILQADHIYAMHQLVIASLTAFSNYFSSKYNQRHEGVVNKIKAIAERDYSQSLTLTDIADEIYLSVNYICAVFKRETGETINEYLTRLRVEEAKRLLRTTKLKVWEIAETLGYENHNYFSTLFKKQTGLKPQQYRSEQG